MVGLDQSLRSTNHTRLMEIYSIDLYSFMNKPSFSFDMRDMTFDKHKFG